MKQTMPMKEHGKESKPMMKSKEPNMKKMMGKKKSGMGSMECGYTRHKMPK